ncbi:MAG TPA: SulP family inorganic anion transporter, partial [Streptosporangiaceae bacterium]|nr:SulP family inorganic anion transporter [Streptosporangiaceae bacterium]
MFQSHGQRGHRVIAGRGLPVAQSRRSGVGGRVRAVLPTRSDWQAARARPLRDVAAGVSVAVVALPLALAYGQSSGMGARAGLATAVV